MALPNGYELAVDAAFRLVAGFTEAPKPGRVTAVLGSGQVRVAVDDLEIGEITAWPLNGFIYAVNDVVFVMFAANAPESGIVIGGLDPLPTLDGSVVDLSSLDPSTINHNGLANLAAGDAHTQYTLLAGRSGGQHLRGGNASGNNLRLESTSHATKGSVRVMSSLAVGGDFAPAARMHVSFAVGGGAGVEGVDVSAAVGTWVTVLPSSTVAGVLRLRAAIRPSSGTAGSYTGAVINGGSNVTMYSAGGNTLLGRVSSGAFEMQRSAGTATFLVGCDMVWM